MTTTPPTDAAPAEDRTRLSSWRLLASNPVTVVSAAVLAIVVFVAVTAQWIVPFGINDVDVPNALTHPMPLTTTPGRTRPYVTIRPSHGGRSRARRSVRSAVCGYGVGSAFRRPFGRCGARL